MVSTLVADQLELPTRAERDFQQFDSFGGKVKRGNDNGVTVWKSAVRGSSGRAAAKQRVPE